MGQTALLLGTPIPFEFEGQTFQVAPRDEDMQGQFEVFLEDRALAAIERHRPRDDGRVEPGRFDFAAYFQQLEGFRKDCAVGLYSWDGPAAVMALAHATGPGKKYLAYLQLVRLNPGVTQDLVARIFRNNAARTRLLLTLDRLNADPLPEVETGASAEGNDVPPASSPPSV